MPFWGTDKSVPEFQRAPADAHDPFRADVYTLGHLVRRDFLEVSRFSESRAYSAHCAPVVGWGGRREVGSTLTRRFRC